MTTYNVFNIDPPTSPGTNAPAEDIDSQGDIVGYADTLGFLYTGGSYAPVIQNGAQMLFFAVNDDDQAVGYYINSGGTFGLLYTHSDAGDSYSNLVPPFSSSPTLTLAFDINALGDVVGYYRSGSDISSDRAYLFKDGTVYLTILPGNEAYAVAINDSDQVVGDYFAGGRDHGFVYDWESDTYITIDVPSSTQTSAEDINNSGQIIGSYRDLHGDLHAFLYSGGHFTTIEVPGAISTDVIAINNAGRIVGSYTDSDGVVHGFVKTGDVYTTIDGPSGDFTAAYNINDSGEVVGTY